MTCLLKSALLVTAIQGTQNDRHTAILHDLGSTGKNRNNFNTYFNYK